MSVREWLALAGQFMILSPFAIGGGITVAPGVHDLLVQRLRLITEDQFTASIALAQASPGPNVLYVAVAGYQAAGLAGAVAAMVGIMLPSSAITLVAARWVEARQHDRAVQAFRAGLAPLTIALLFATSWVLATEQPGWAPTALTVGVAVLVGRTRIHLLWLMAAGAVVGALGVV